ncbi:beta-glucoside-specific PTS transporter subunit IIABC [Enterococcus thailandicus]|uniref:beta-glucoside-specific PTS transporter subunit IIABC n=1 Tax=Enterococcus thailandicus TaxID=417368 RepID=UPI0022EBB29A|nr:beta-glucoside-specific PTS transporter subunit IIABC [Enterococcus thailandicus]MDA3972764.1 beta-glucoside-specific PTS transporter subunit IIABC [Enterococcus thailandicus]MDA3975260.1 beta-glucoside-specific PTS transporter subunit IIABC [Enterococcus thailandicus]MDA3980224.1 beta-glucoside-specific PTS transporter subunit IIABC [Enterococcus thailandicus]
MSKKYEQLSKEILDSIGGTENISSMTHCQTRLRLVLKNNEIVDNDEVKKINGVVNVIESGGQFQVVIGTHVEEVYEEIDKLSDLSDEDESALNEGDKQQSFIGKFIDFISSTIAPVVPAIAGAGMIKAFLALLLLFNLISRESQTYFIVNFMADAVFYFLPFFLASTAAQKLKASPFLAMFLAGILLHPNLSQLVSQGDPVAIFGVPMRLVNYSSSVIPILMIVFLQSYVERFLKKIIPDAIKIIFVPMLTVLFVGTIGLTILGPIGGYVGDYIAMGFEFLASYGNWAVVFMVATFWPLMVMFGIHYSLGPISTMQLATTGLENIVGPGAIISNISQGVAAFVVGFRTRKTSEKSVAISTGVTALMGITEPALYGINLPKRYPLISAMIGSACGGLYAGFTNVYRYATGASGIPAIPLYIGEDIWHLYNILIALVITIVVTAALTWVLSFKFENKDETADEVEKEILEEVSEIKLGGEVMFSPLKGKVVSLSEVEDEAFSSETLGKGVAIYPEDGIVVAPFEGEISALFPTKHAIGVVSNNGMEVLIHVGMDTVALNGEHFEAFVKKGDKVKKGQKLVTFDIDAISKAGYSTIVPVVVTNTNSYSDISIKKNDAIQFEDELLVAEI